MENQERDEAHEDPLRKLAGQVDNYRRQAEQLGRLLSGRALLECPSCGLHEDERADMTRIVSTEEDPSRDTGLRFSPLDDDESTWLCPGCGLPFSPDPSED